MSELLPCPFCGATKVEDCYVRDGRRVRCLSCHASAGPQFHGPKGDTSERAAAAWNTRASGWLDIATAPKDADNIDLWCRNISAGSTDQTRFTGMFVNSDGQWEDWHGYVLEPKWKPTHWKRPDVGPEAQP